MSGSYVRKICVMMFAMLGFTYDGALAASRTKEQPVSEAPAQDPVAGLFGRMPYIWDLRLSPDGSRLSFLTMDRDELPMLVIYDFARKQSRPVLLSVPDKADIQWCKWANSERLLCGYVGIVRDAHMLYGATRLVAINADGSKMKVLMQRQLSEQFAQFQDRIIDDLVDDPEHVLIELPDGLGTGTARLNIYDGSLDQKTFPRDNVRGYISDGRGTPRLYNYFDGEKIRWHYRLAGETKWRLLHSDHIGSEESEYQPLGFGDDPNKLLVLKPHQGRMALWAEDLTADETKKRAETLIYANPEADVTGVQTLGKHDRVVAARYATDSGHLEFFDKDIERVVAGVEALYPDQQVQVTDESLDQRFYILHVSSDRNPGVFYRFDKEKRELSPIQSEYPQLNGRTLSRMNTVRFTARDGVKVTGYLTRPQGEKQKGLPLVVLPHGGPQSRDVWGYDWLPQYLAAKGYAVLQVNYRGSAGFGEDWMGAGGFKAWRQALDDITDGVQGTIKAGISDPARICAVGWSYGGYAALMSGIEHSELYRCIVSVAGVTDLETLKKDQRYFINRRVTAEFVGRDDEVILRGSPLLRAAEIKVPVFLAHGDKDMNVRIRHSEKMAGALKAAGKPYEFIQYKNAEHSLERTSWRVDLLTRMGAFLDRHIGDPERMAAGP